MKLKKAKDKKRSAKVIFAIVLIIVLFVPMVYASIYLGSVFNVYGKLDSVPVAFVNLDKPFTKDGKEYALGREIEKGLKDNKKVGWRFVSLEAAMEGLKGTKYYALVEIPESFSENIASAQQGNFNNTQIIYMGNKGRNFVFSQISSKVADSIKATVSASIQKETSKALVDSLFEVKASLKTAGEGAFQLQEGTDKLLDGSKKLATGVGNAANGSVQLEGGLKLAADASMKLQAGTDKLFTGSSDLSKGLNAGAQGSKQLQEGLKNITGGQSQIVNGSSVLVDGLKSLKDGLTKPNDQVSLLVKGASDISSKAEAMSQGAGQLDSSVSALAEGIKQADTALQEELGSISNSNLSEEDKTKLIAAISKASDGEVSLTKATSSIHQLALNLQLLKGGTSQVSTGVSSVAAGLADSQSKAATGLDKLIGGAEGIENGSSTILAGMNTATDKTSQLANGLEALSNGSTALNDGLNTVKDGNMSLGKGLNTAAESTMQLANGLNTLSAGANSLSNGLDTANQGLGKLETGLNNGYVKMNDKLKFNSDNMSQFVSEPVTVKDNSINDVKLYGEGLAPYFMSLSLWIGAMVISIVFSMVKSKKLFESKFMNSYLGKFSVGAILAVLQGLILSFVLIKWVGVNPINLPVFYLTNMAFAIVFFSIFYGVSEVIGVLTTPVLFIVLLLQLASSGGTFPIESAPLFYRVVNKIVPMSYSVSTLRMTISGINQAVLKQNMLVLLIFMATTLAGGYFIPVAIKLFKKKANNNVTKVA